MSASSLNWSARQFLWEKHFSVCVINCAKSMHFQNNESCFPQNFILVILQIDRYLSIPFGFGFLKNASFVWRITWNPGNGICHFSPVSDAASEGSVFPLTWIGLQGISFALPMQNSPVSCKVITGHGPMSVSWPPLWRAMGLNAAPPCKEFWMPPQENWGQKATGSDWWITPHTHTLLTQLCGCEISRLWV